MPHTLLQCRSCLSLHPVSWLLLTRFYIASLWFLSLRVFGLLSSSLWLFPQRFGRYVLQLSFGVCRTREPTLRTTSYIKSMGVTCSDSVSHNWVQVLSIPVLLLVCSHDWTCNLQMIVSLEAWGTNAYNRYAMCPAGE